MRLINTTSLELRHVVDSTQEKYVILSHVWGNEEISFQELGDPAVRVKSGFDKIEKTCSLARQQGFNWAWVDTCCIDKTSSAELSEAINSMFNWYRDSQVCYVLLADLEPVSIDMNGRDRRAFLGEHLSRCGWFTRGWTLQELIASREVEFYDQEWNFVGTKSGLKQSLSSITYIDSSVLSDSSALRDVPVGRRMSWASMRQTTRKEDMAYCLLGIFDINMPLLYGEGDKAFIRLQDAITTGTSDFSLFAWQIDSRTEDNHDLKRRIQNGHIPVPRKFGGIFASSPSEFRHCTTIKRHHDRLKYTCSVDGDSIRIEPNLLRVHLDSNAVLPGLHYYALDLGCIEVSERTLGKPSWLSIYVANMVYEFVRVMPDLVGASSSRSQWGHTWKGSRGSKPILIKKRLLPGEQDRMMAFIGSKFTVLHKGNFPRAIKRLATDGYPRPDFDETNSPTGTSLTLRSTSCHSIKGIINLELKVNMDGKVDGTPGNRTVHCVIICGIDWKEDHLEPWIAIFTDQRSHGHTSHKSADEIITHSLAASDAMHNTSLRDIHDIMLRDYSNSSGSIIQEMMPQSAVLNSRWKLSLSRIMAVDPKKYAFQLEFHEILEAVSKFPLIC